MQKSLADNHRKNFDADDFKSRIGAQWSNDWLRVGGYIGSSKEKGGLPGSLSAAAYAQDPSQAGGYTQRFMLRHEDHGLFAQAQLGAWELAADGKWRTKAFRSTDNFAGFSDSDVKSKNFSLRAKHQIKTDGYTNALTLGFDHSKTDADRRSTWSAAKPSAKNIAWYIKDDISFPSNGTQLSAGLRTEKVDRVSGVQALHQRLHAWDLGVTQAITPQWSAFARLAKAFRVANVDELPPFGAAGILEPQTSRDLEAGLRWNTTDNKLELRAYRSRLEHEIALNDGGIGGFTNINFDPTKRSGIELDGSTAISKTVQLSAHLGLRRAEFRSGAYAGKRVPLVPKQALSLGADWQALPGHDLMARANFVGKQAVLVSNGCQVPGFATLDVGYRYTVGSWELNTQVQNLGDKRYYNWAFGCVNPNTPTGIYPESGRRINATLSYQF